MPDKKNKSINPNYSLKKSRLHPPGYYIEGIGSGNRTILSQAITLIESSHPERRELGEEILEKCLHKSGHSVRIGITGVPGAGKSTFIDAFGKLLINHGKSIAVLTVDPSSSRSKGSILGDKTRMEYLSAHEKAYIRPTAASGTLGGVARKTREAMLLCEAAGFDTIFIETVGVGQSETTVHSMTDFFLLLMIAGAGDELQGIKRGIMEMADLLAINKADGDNVNKARTARSQYENALHLFPPPPTGWTPKVKTCSSITKNGIPEVWEMIREHESLMKARGHFEDKRNRQQRHRLHESINESLKSHFYNDPVIQKKISEAEKMLATRQMTSFQAAKVLLDSYFGRS